MLSRHAIKKILPFIMVFTLSGCQKTPEPENTMTVHYQKIQEERLTLKSDLPGRISAQIVSEVRPQVSGIISKRLFEEGSDVTKGQILYQIDPAEYKAAYHMAKASLAEAKASVTSLALLEKRYRILIKTSSISQQDLDNVISSHRQARARVDKAKAELETAAINLDYTQVKAPVSGRIGASTVTPGALVTANQSTALATIQQINRVYVDIPQSSADLIRLRRNFAQGKMSTDHHIVKVRLTLEDGSPYTPIGVSPENSPEQWIEGDLLFSEIHVGETTGSVILRAIFSNPDRLLLPGMYVTAHLTEGILEKAVLIPQRSVLSSGKGEHFVFVLEKTSPDDKSFRAIRRPVELGHSFGNRWIVKKGLAAGELLVVEGLQKVSPGKNVSAIPAPGQSDSGKPALLPATDHSSVSREETR